MTRFTSFIIGMCNLRTAFAVATAWLLIVGTVPQGLRQATGVLERTVFRGGLHFMSLPELQTQITLIHVPAIEFDRWMADLSGASRLLEILDMTVRDPLASQSGSLIGLVSDRPFSLIRPETEALLEEVQKTRASDGALFDDVEQALARRGRLMAYLQSNHTVLGLFDRFSRQQRIPIHDEFQERDHSPAWLAQWLWTPPPEMEADLRSPVLTYTAIPSMSYGKRFLLVRDRDRLAPTFWVDFLIADKQRHQSSDQELLPALHYIPSRGLRINGTLIESGHDSGIVPIYGALSGIRAPMRQITLGAALKQNALDGWVLLGKDGGDRLDHTAQVLVSLADNAYLTEPLWWSGISKLLLFGLGVILYFFVPRVSFRGLMVLLTTVSGALIGSQIVGQFTAFYWLPVGNLLLYLWFGSALLLVWRWQKTRQLMAVQRADNASFALADGLIEAKQWAEALTLVRRCSPSAERRSQLERIAGLAEQFHQWDVAAQAWRSLKGFNLDYRRYAAREKLCSQKITHHTSGVVLKERQGHSEQAWQGGKSVATEVSPARASFGQYQVKRLLGQGLHGRLYLGYDSQQRREVLIKTPYVGFRGKEMPLRQTRLFRDLSSTTALQHPAIVPVVDVGEEADVAYMVTEKPSLPALSDQLKGKRLLPVHQVYRIVLDLADALDYAHQNGCVHRNVRLDCIYYSADPFQVLLTDFGLQGAEELLRTRSEDVYVIAPYLSPEQVLGEEGDLYSDIFSLGVVFYQLLTGRLPFSGSSLATLSHQIVHGAHPTARSVRPSLPASATRITDVALRKGPQERFASARVFHQVLRQALKRDFADGVYPGDGFV